VKLFRVYKYNMDFSEFDFTRSEDICVCIYMCICEQNFVYLCVPMRISMLYMSVFTHDSAQVCLYECIYTHTRTYSLFLSLFHPSLRPSTPSCSPTLSLPLALSFFCSVSRSRAHLLGPKIFWICSRSNFLSVSLHPVLFLLL